VYTFRAPSLVPLRPVAVDRRTGPWADGHAAWRCIVVYKYVEPKYVGYVVTGSRT